MKSSRLTLVKHGQYVTRNLTVSKPLVKAKEHTMPREKKDTRLESESANAVKESVADNGMELVRLRPDGYHWQAPDGKQEFGPFETLELALADMNTANGESPEPGETLQEAEDEIGISAWIDRETGEPAEGLSHPRFEE